MRECLTCSVAKPDPCYQSAKSGVCLACMGRFARRDRDRRRGEAILLRRRKELRTAYPDQDDPAYRDVPETFFIEWCREMKALLPTQWDKL